MTHPPQDPPQNPPSVTNGSAGPAEPHTEGTRKSLVPVTYLMSIELAWDTFTLGKSNCSRRRWLCSRRRWSLYSEGFFFGFGMVYQSGTRQVL